MAVERPQRQPSGSAARTALDRGDICVNACKVMERRIRAHFDSLWDSVEFIGMPKTVDDTKTLARLDKCRFERWAASLVDGMKANTRQCGDKRASTAGADCQSARGSSLIWRLRSKAVARGRGCAGVQWSASAGGADLGIFTCFDDRVTQGMRDAAASAGRFTETPVVQIYTIEDYFTGGADAFQSSMAF